MPGGAPSSPVRGPTASPAPEGVPSLPALVMAALAHRDGLWGDAVLEIAVGAAPAGGLVLAGLEEARAAALGLRVSPEALSWLQEAGPPLPARFFTALRVMRFQGELLAAPEGTALPAGAPALRLRAPLAQALLLADTLLLHLRAGSAAATRTAALARAAEGRPLVELSDLPGAVGAAALRGAQIGGLSGTTQLQAAMAAGLPLWGRIPAAAGALWADPAAPWMLARELFGPRVVVELPGDDLHEGVRRLAAVGVDPGLVCAEGPDLPGRCAALRRALDRSGLRLTRVIARIAHVDDLAALKGAPVDACAAPLRLLCPDEAPLHVELAELPVDADLPAGPGRSPYTTARGLVRGPGGDLLCRPDAEELHRGPRQAPLMQRWAQEGAAVAAPAPVPARPLPAGWTVQVADDLRPRPPAR